MKRTLSVLLACFSFGCVSAPPQRATSRILAVLSAAVAYETASLASINVSPLVLLDATTRDTHPEEPAGFSLSESGDPFSATATNFPTLPTAQQSVSLRDIRLPAGVSLFPEPEFRRVWLKHRDRLPFLGVSGWHGFVVLLDVPHFEIGGSKAIVRLTTLNPRNDCGGSSLLLAEETPDGWRIVGLGNQFIQW